MIIVNFFRDVLDGIWYWLYLIVCIISFFFVLGIVADNKREKINKKLKEKKSYDIESGREAAIAAMETKQVLSVNEDENKEDSKTVPATNPAINKIPEEKKEEEPLVINSKEEPTVMVKDTLPPLEPVVQPVASPVMTPIEQARNEEPLVISSNQ